MASYHGGRWVARALKKEGIDVLFTLSGFHIAPIYEGCLDEGIRVIDVRHEQASTHAADAWARLTGKPGVAVVTAGPGVTDAATGVANAYQADSPVVLLGGQAPFVQLEMGALQDMDHLSFMRPITKWARSCHETRRLPEFVAIAIRQAMTGRKGPVFLETPMDVLLNLADESEAVDPVHYRTDTRSFADPAQVAAALALLGTSRRPAVIAGNAVWWNRGWEALRDFAERAQLPVYLNAMGRGALPPDHPCHFTQTRKKALAEADLVFVFGTPIDFRLAYGKSIHPEAKVVQVDVDGTLIGHNRGADLGLVGDVGAILSQLAAGVERAPERPWLRELRGAEEEAWRKLEPLLHSEAVPIHPLRFAFEIDRFKDAETVLIGDGGNIVANAAKVIRLERPGQWLDPGRFGCLGVGMPFAIAAKVALPAQKVLLINGDGSFLLNGAEFDTAVRHKLPVVSVVGNDAAWNQIRVPQTMLYGEDRAVATDLALTRYDRVVEALGGHGEFVERPGDLRPALERAFASGRPACVNVVIDRKANSGGYGGIGIG